MRTRRRLALALIQVSLLALAMPRPTLAQADQPPPAPLMTAGELHRRIFIMGYYLNQASSALAAGDPGGSRGPVRQVPEGVRRDR